MKTVLRWAAGSLLCLSQTVFAADYFIYVGTYTNQKSKGIYAWRFDPAAGKLAALGLVAETSSPSFLAVHPNGRFLYAVNEVSVYEGQRAGSVSAFAIDQKTGSLSLLNAASTRGPGPCHLALDRSGKCLIVANYGGGSIAAFPVDADGRLGEASAFFQNSGAVALRERQGGPHAHCVLVSPDNRFLLVADLGLDQVQVYRLDAAKAQLTPNTPLFAKVAPGSGPRHLVFHPSGRFVYVINEIKSTIGTFSYSSSTGELHDLQTVSTLPKDFHGENNSAEIAAHPSGRFVYTSNRGDDSIAVFEVDRTSGTLKPVERVPTQGKVPRNFAIDPTGSYLLVANQNSDNIVLFRIDRSTGRLTPANQVIETPSPVCITFVAAD